MAAGASATSMNVHSRALPGESTLPLTNFDRRADGNRHLRGLGSRHQATPADVSQKKTPRLEAGASFERLGGETS